MKKAIIFDFDGTLVDSSPVIFAIYKDIARQKGWKKMSKKTFKSLRKGTILGFIKWINVWPWHLPWLVREGKRRYRLQTDRVELFEGTKKMVKDLQKEGWQLYILSTNDPITIKNVLRKYNLQNDFKILKNSSFFSKGKVIKSLLKSSGLKPANVWMVGDELRDIRAAKKAKVNSIAVSWGLQDINVLKRAKPLAIAHEPSDIMKTVKG